MKPKQTADPVVELEKLLSTDPSIAFRLPAKPDEPLPKDCCGLSCDPCVFDIYRQDLERWAVQCLSILKPDEYGLFGPKEAKKTVHDLTISPNWYQKFELVDIQKQTHDTAIYRFKLPENCRLNIPLGSHIVLRGALSNGYLISKPYTPISSSEDVGFFDLLIKTYSRGKMSSFISTLKIGAMVEMRGPFGTFQFSYSEYADILLLCSGVGITPFIRIIQHILDDEDASVRIKLLYACRSYNQICLKQRLDGWKTFWNFSVCYYVNDIRTEQTKISYGDDVRFQKLDPVCVSEELKRVNNPDKCLVLICGSNSFNKDMINYVKKCSVLVKRFFKF